MKRFVVMSLMLSFVALGCGTKSERQAAESPQILTVFCGAGIRPAMEPIRAEFEQRNNCTVRMSYAGSGTLLGQLQAGSEADLYLPGDIWYIRQAAAKEMIDSHQVAAWFVPVIAVQKGNPKGITGIADLAGDDLKLGLGRAEACAIGNVSVSLLEAAGLGGKVEADFEALTVNRLANQVKLKAIDAAVVWDATAKQYPDSIDAVTIEDADFHAVALAIGVLERSRDKRLASEFASFVGSDFGAASFRENHYQVPGKRLRIGCGASMRPPLEALAKLFEKETGCGTLRDYGGSGTVLLQIEESKEGDVYVCHDPFAYICEEKGMLEYSHTIAYVEPTLAVAKGNPRNVRGFKDLLRPDLKLGLPHRKRSTRGVILWEMLRRSGMAEEVGRRKFFESRTHDLVNQLKLGAVDLAVLWDAPVNAMPEIEVIPIEASYKVDAITSATTGRTYPLEHVKVTVVRLTFSNEPLLAAQFARLCLSPQGRAILDKHHFNLP